MRPGQWLVDGQRVEPLKQVGMTNEALRTGVMRGEKAGGNGLFDREHGKAYSVGRALN